MPNEVMIADKMSNFVASLLCYVIMPLTPFIFEYLYSSPHIITKRSVMIALSAYSFSLAFGTKFRVISIVLIVNGFLIGGMYGSVNHEEIAEVYSFPCVIFYILILMAVFEWGWRHFFENEDCWFYSIFQRSQNQEGN